MCVGGEGVEECARVEVSYDQRLLEQYALKLTLTFDCKSLLQV